MITEQRLNNFKKLNIEYKQLEQQVETLRSFIEHCKSPALTGMPRGGGDDDVMAQNVSYLIELETRLLDKLCELSKEQLFIEKAIEKLEPIERVIIRYRYAFGYPWWKIANIINYSEVHTKRYGYKILDKLKKNDTL